MATIDFSSIPAPEIIEPLDFESILAEMIADLQERDPSYTEILESDPGVKILEVAAARELILRQRVNDALQATLLRYAGGGDLDNLAAFYGVTRLTDEADDALRVRVIERIMGSSTAGGSAWYRYQALSASELVKDAAVSSPAPGEVLINILSTQGNGAASPALLAAVDDVMQSDSVRVITDVVTVAGATINTVAVTAQVYLYPDTPIEVFNGLQAQLQAAFAAASGLGWDVTRSWLIAQLHPAGVQRVILTAPAADVVCGPSQAPALGAITLTMAGRDR
jgi:phage-related baseplate assembly protein